MSVRAINLKEKRIMNMNAKAYDKLTAAFAGFIIQNIPADLSSEVMGNWMQDPNAMKRFLCGLKPPKVTIPKPEALFATIATTCIGSLESKATSQCCTGLRWSYRDSKLDNGPVFQPKTGIKDIATLVSNKCMTFAQMAASIVEAEGATNISLIGKLLKERGHTMTLTQCEEMVEATEREEKTCMRTSGKGNFFFVENEDGSVSVGSVIRAERAWVIGLNSLGHLARLDAGQCYLVCI